jgi:trehalose 6-phosphate phosphatase
VLVAIVSGRSFSDLRSLLGDTPGVVVIGEHGNDRGEEILDPAEVVEEMADFVRRVGETLPGSAVEVKRQGVGFHYRRANEGEAERAVDSILTWAEERPEIKVTMGKMIVEMSISPHHKGDAVLALKEEAGAECVVFIGDDTTDENVFAMLGESDIGIKVGPGETAADYRVDDITNVVDVLVAIESALG